MAMMDPHLPSQDAEVLTLTTANAGENETTTVNRSTSTTNGHTDTVLEKTIEALSSDAIKIEPSVEEIEEKADDGAGSRSVSIDDGDGPRNIPLNNDRLNVCLFHLPPFSEHWKAQDDFQGAHTINEHQAPTDHLSTHDTNGQHSEPASSILTDVSYNLCLTQSLVRSCLGCKAHPPSRRAIHS